MTSQMGRENIHATAISLDNRGLLIRGPSGSGKSLLALFLLDHWSLRGRDAALVADDRVDLAGDSERILMSPPATIAGLIELRGRGILSKPYRANVRLDLVVDLVPTLERMPETHDLRVELLGQIVARAPVPQVGVIGMDHQRMLIEEALGATSIGW